MGKAQAICRLKRISPDVQLIEHGTIDSKRLSYSGVSSCKSSLCPLCAPKWQRTRVGEITAAVEHWGARFVCFGTLTMRHHLGMPLALQHRILTRAYGHLWSGRAGQELAAEFGGRPESVRAHDRTWSKERGWHPHLHVLLFLQSEAKSPAELEELLWLRWSGEPIFGPRLSGWNGRETPGALASALRSFQSFCRRTLARASCYAERGTKLEEHALCSSLRGCLCYGCTLARARRLFGTKLLPKNEPLVDSLRRISGQLAAFTEQGIAPVRARGVQLESVRGTDKAPKYLAKLGLELAWSASKSVNVVDGVAHYPYWALAHLATRHGDPLRKHARRAWTELFKATRGTQAITFSNRKALGLGPDPYAENQEPAEQADGEYSRCLGIVSGATWDEMRKVQQHGLLVTLGEAHDAGLLEELPYVKPPPGWSGVPASRGPPPVGYVPLEAHERAFRIAAAERRGGAVVRAAWLEVDRPREDANLWLEEIRFRMKQAGVPVARSWRTTPYGHPW